MKRFIVAALCLAAGIAAVAQVKKDLTTLIQAGDSKQALQQIQAGANVNQRQPDGTSALLWAVNQDNREVAQALLAKKADPNVGNDFGAMPLTEAARHSDAALVKMLLDAGAKVDTANPDGETALMVAIKGGNPDVVRMLIDKGANVNQIEKFHQQTPLMYAASGNHPEIVKLLIAKGADVKPHAMFSDWPSQITSEPRWQFRPTGGLTALQYAARAGCYQCTEDLLAAGADVNDPTPEGVTPLMIAIDNSNNDVAQLMMAKGADLDVQDWWGRTPLWIAVDRKTPPGGGGARGGAFGGAPGGGRGPGAPGAAAGAGRGGPAGPGAPLGARGGTPAAPRGPVVTSMDIINALLDKGVNPNPEMNFHRPNAPGRGRFADNQISTGTTPLFRAVQNNDLEVIKALLAKGADPNRNGMSYTPFLLAAGVGPGGRGGNGGGQVNLELLQLMMDHFADPNTKVTGLKTFSLNIARTPATNEGTSALHEAARKGQVDLVKFLLDHGADPNLLNAEGQKPIDVIGQSNAPAGPGGAPAGAGAGKGKGGPPAGRSGNQPALEEIRGLLTAAAAKK